MSDKISTRENYEPRCSVPNHKLPINVVMYCFMSHIFLVDKAKPTLKDTSEYRNLQIVDSFRSTYHKLSISWSLWKNGNFQIANNVLLTRVSKYLYILPYIIISTGNGRLAITVSPTTHRLELYGATEHCCYMWRIM